MNVKHKTHKELVGLWEEQNTRDLSEEQLLQVYGSAFRAIEQRCLATLSKVTLDVVLDRVLHLGTEKFPFYSDITIESSGFGFKNLTQKNDKYRIEDLRAGLSCLIEEVLTVIGNITSDVMTESLHKELMKVTKESALSVQKVQSLNAVNADKKNRGGK